MTIYEAYLRSFTGLSLEQFNIIVENFKKSGKKPEEVLQEFMEKRKPNKEQIEQSIVEAVFLEMIKKREKSNN